MEDLLTLLSSGKYLPAVGLVLVAVVSAARAGIGAYVPWLRTKVGGYVLGFGAAALLYVGTSLEAGQGVSLGLLSSALAAGWVAAGGWEHLRDVLDAFRGKSDPNAEPAPLPRAVARYGSMLIVLLVLAFVPFMTSACHGTGTGAQIGSMSIDCTISHAEEIADLVSDFEATLKHGGSWHTVYEDAKAAGVDIGGCALAEFVQSRLSTPLKDRGEVGDRWDARDTLERFRREVANGATFVTASGSL